MFNGWKWLALSLVAFALVTVLPASNKETELSYKCGSLALGYLALAGGCHLYCYELKKEVLAEVKKMMDQTKGQN
jgi:hypothetical protein